jgi:hypothetical protein
VKRAPVPIGQKAGSGRRGEKFERCAVKYYVDLIHFTYQYPYAFVVWLFSFTFNNFTSGFVVELNSETLLKRTAATRQQAVLLFTDSVAYLSRVKLSGPVCSHCIATISKFHCSNHRSGDYSLKGTNYIPSVRVQLVICAESFPLRTPTDKTSCHEQDSS